MQRHQQARTGPIGGPFCSHARRNSVRIYGQTEEDAVIVIVEIQRCVVVLEEEGAGPQIWAAEEAVAKAELNAVIKQIHSLGTTAGDTYNHGDAVYQTASAAGDAQTITNTIGVNTKVLGYVMLRPAQAPVAGGAQRDPPRSP